MSLTLHDPMDCGPTRLLCPWHFPGRNTGVAISSSRGSSCKIITSQFFQVGSKEIKTVNPKGNQSWIFIGRTDAEAEAPILWSPDVKSWLIGKDPDAGKDWRQEEKGTTEGETVREDHRLNGHELGQVLGDGKGQGSLVHCNHWITKSWTWLSDWTTTTTILYSLKIILYSLSSWIPFTISFLFQFQLIFLYLNSFFFFFTC